MLRMSRFMTTSKKRCQIRKDYLFFGGFFQITLCVLNVSFIFEVILRLKTENVYKKMFYFNLKQIRLLLLLLIIIFEKHNVVTVSSKNHNLMSLLGNTGDEIKEQ